MSTLLPAAPPGPVPSGTDLRDLRPWFNAVQSCLTGLVTSARMAALQPQRMWSPPPHVAPGSGGLSGVPVGGVIMWFGAATGGVALTLPGSDATWAVCDGSTVDGRSTPDLQALFIRGKEGAQSPGNTSTGGSTQPDNGGSDTHTHTDHTLSIAAHTHNIPALDVTPDPSAQSFCTGQDASLTLYAWSSSTNLVTGADVTGAGGSISETLEHSTSDNIPGYAVCIFLMRIA